MWAITNVNYVSAGVAKILVSASSGILRLTQIFNGEGSVAPLPQSCTVRRSHPLVAQNAFPLGKKSLPCSKNNNRAIPFRAINPLHTLRVCLFNISVPTTSSFLKDAAKTFVRMSYLMNATRSAHPILLYCVPLIMFGAKYNLLSS